MKRFTATEKWDDSWFRKLSPISKCFWSYICERCDCAGVWKVDLEAAEFFIGSKLSEKELTETFRGRIDDLGGGRWWIVKFIEFQYGRLSPDCKPHIPIFKALERHGIPLDRLSKPFAKAIDSLEEKEKEIPQDGGTGEGNDDCVCEPSKYSKARIVLHFLNQQAGRCFRETTPNLTVIQARVDEVKGDIEGIKTMITRQCARWKGTEQDEYLRPETLFNKTKFGSYYDNRELPVAKSNGSAGHQNPRNVGLAGDSEERNRRIVETVARMQQKKDTCGPPASNGVAADKPQP